MNLSASNRTAHSFHVAPTNINGLSGKRLLIILRSPGCIYLRSESTACTFCGFKHLTNPSLHISDEEYGAQIRSVLDSIADQVNEIIEINVYNSGNFFCDVEMTPNARNMIGRELSSVRGLLSLTVDCRPEFLTRSNLAAFRDSIGQPELSLSVGLGLEVFDDLIRGNMLNKRFDRRDFGKSLDILQNEGYGALVYVMVKPGPMSDEVALDQVARAGAFVKEHADRLSLPYRFALEPTFVVEGTPLAKLYVAAQYAPPTLELVAEAASVLVKYGAVNVGLWDEDLPILARAQSSRSTSILSRLEQFNSSQDADDLWLSTNSDSCHDAKELVGMGTS